MSKTVSELIEALEHDNIGVRNDAAHALGRIGPAAKDAIHALIEVMREEGWEVRNQAANALQMITPGLHETTMTDNSDRNELERLRKHLHAMDSHPDYEYCTYLDCIPLYDPRGAGWKSNKDKKKTTGKSHWRRFKTTEKQPSELAKRIADEDLAEVRLATAREFDKLLDHLETALELHRHMPTAGGYD